MTNSSVDSVPWHNFISKYHWSKALIFEDRISYMLRLITLILIVVLNYESGLVSDAGDADTVFLDITTKSSFTSVSILKLGLLDLIQTSTSCLIPITYVLISNKVLSCSVERTGLFGSYALSKRLNQLWTYIIL